MTNLFITAQQRSINEVNELLKYEIDIPPPALIIAKTGDVKFSSKSKLTDSMIDVLQEDRNTNESIFMDTELRMLIIDASVWIQSNRLKKSCKTFSDYADILVSKIDHEFKHYDRIDVIFDRYFEKSTKSVTRSSRGTTRSGTRYIVKNNTPVPSD